MFPRMCSENFIPTSICYWKHIAWWCSMQANSGFKCTDMFCLAFPLSSPTPTKSGDEGLPSLLVGRFSLLSVSLFSLVFCCVHHLKADTWGAHVSRGFFILEKYSYSINFNHCFFATLDIACTRVHACSNVSTKDRWYDLVLCPSFFCRALLRQKNKHQSSHTKQRGSLLTPW